MTAPRDPALDLPLDAPEADVIEQRTPVGSDRPVAVSPGPVTTSPEVPEADAAEQATPVVDDPDEVAERSSADPLVEADAADLAEQSVPVRLDDGTDDD
jgi:hypothetical protein